MAYRSRVAPDPRLQITLLGRFTLRGSNGDDPIRVPTRVQQLLAYLLLNPNREFRRAHLAEVLWGSRRLETSRKHLRQALWGLRSCTAHLADGDLLRCQGEWVRASVNGNVRIDAMEFDDVTSLLSSRAAVPLNDETAAMLGAAARLYEGDLLDGWDQEWCAGPREHLRRRFLAVMDVLTAHFEAVGDYDRAAGAAARSLEIDPARESAHRCLIRLMMRAGDRSGAVRQYRACETAVRDELGVAPDGSTVALYDEIARGGRT